jgi:hypothetical protein
VSRLSPSVAASHILSSCATLHTSDCVIPFIIGHVSPRNTITRVVSVAPLYVSAVLALTCILLARQTVFDPHFGQSVTL